jgi:hypothetical protein
MVPMLVGQAITGALPTRVNKHYTSDQTLYPPILLNYFILLTATYAWQ